MDQLLQSMSLVRGIQDQSHTPQYTTAPHQPMVMHPAPSEMVLLVRPTKLCCIVVFQLIPRDQFCKLDPAIITSEFAAKRQEEVFEREPMKMPTQIYVDTPGRFWVQIGSFHAHLTAKNR